MDMRVTGYRTIAASTAVPERLFWFGLTVLCIAGTVGWNWYAGKDLNWDSLNYHLYVALQWSEGRLKQDFMAGSIQSYLNPIGYLPFFWMVRAGWHSLTIASVLAAVHALNLVLIGSIASAVLPRTVRHRFLWVFASVLVAAINPVFATEIGNTFIDITTSILILGACALLFHQLFPSARNDIFMRRRSPDGVYLVAGLLLGIACGLKLTNAVFAVTFLPLVLARHHGVPQVATRTILYAVGGLAGTLLVDGHWAWTLYREFGNPIFPFSNAFFRSPDFPSVNFVDHRFLPETVADRLLFPLRALLAEPGIFTELCTPEMRFLCFFVLLGLYPLARAWHRHRARAGKEGPPAFASPQWWFLGTWIFGYAVWLNTFGIGRYFLAGLLLLGPAIILLLLGIGGAHRFMVYLLALILTWQVAFMAASGHRWTPAPWSASWFDYRIPAVMKEKPYLYLSTRTLTQSFLAAFVHPQSSFANIAGQATMAENGPGAARLRELMRNHQGRIRSLFTMNLMDLDRSEDPNGGQALVARMFDGVFERFGLQTDVTTCVFVDGADYLRMEARHLKGGNPFTARIMSCELVPMTQHVALDRAMLQRVDRVFDRIEHTCPNRFAPAGTVTIPLPGAWARTYFNSVVTLVYVPASDKIEYLLLGGGTVRLGRLADWEQAAPPPHDCSVKMGQRMDIGVTPVAGKAQ